jgi:hypothetical protein
MKLITQKTCTGLNSVYYDTCHLHNAVTQHTNTKVNIMTKVKASVKNFLTISAQSSEQRAQAAAELEAQHAQHQDDDVKREAQRVATHARYDAKLSVMSEKAATFAVDVLNCDANKIVNASRELKKRLIAICESAANNAAIKDKALAAFIAQLKSSKKSAYTLSEIQSIMSHATTTQASYMKTAFLMFNACEYSSTEKKVTIKRDSNLIKALIAAN